MVVKPESSSVTEPHEKEVFRIPSILDATKEESGRRRVKSLSAPGVDPVTVDRFGMRTVPRSNCRANRSGAGGNKTINSRPVLENVILDRNRRVIISIHVAHCTRARGEGVAR